MHFIFRFLVCQGLWSVPCIYQIYSRVSWNHSAQLIVLCFNHMVCSNEGTLNFYRKYDNLVCNDKRTTEI